MQKTTLRGRPRLGLTLEHILQAVRRHQRVLVAARELRCSDAYIHVRLKQAGLTLRSVLEAEDVAALLRQAAEKGWSVETENLGKGEWRAERAEEFNLRERLYSFERRFGQSSGRFLLRCFALRFTHREAELDPIHQDWYRLCLEARGRAIPLSCW